MSRDALFQAILANPEDDAVRLVYADWLDEHGNAARAEFIRVQIRLAQLAPCDLEWPSLRQRELTLLQEHRRTWEAELPELPDDDDEGCWLSWGAFRRGFIDEVRGCRAAVLLRMETHHESVQQEGTALERSGSEAERQTVGRIL